MADIEALARELALVREQIGILRGTEAELSAEIAEELRGQQGRFGPWLVMRHKSADRKDWQSESLFSYIVGMTTVDAEGEKLDDAAARQRLVTVLHGCFPLTGSCGWRTRALRSFGIDPDEWCKATPAPDRIEVVSLAQTEEPS